MILNTTNFVGPGKNSDDPLMILEEEEPRPLVSVITKRMNSLEGNSKGPYSMMQNKLKFCSLCICSICTLKFCVL